MLYHGTNNFWTREEIDAMYQDAIKLAEIQGLPAPIAPTESCSECGRNKYGWCGVVHESSERT